MATGYATLYGDMCGGYNVLKDVYKTTVFTLAKWRNAQNLVMPERVITKPPSAELKPNQTDQDSLPPYDILDAILECLIEKRQSVADIISQGFDEATVKKVVKLLQRSEYKRRQAAPGVKLTSMSFGRDWRMPLIDKS
jgi:NAD+ synthase